MTKTISTTVSDEFWDLAQKNNVSWAEALRTGLAVMFADRGLMEYNNNLNLFRKMTAFRMQAEEALQKLADLEAKQNTQ